MIYNKTMLIISLLLLGLIVGTMVAKYVPVHNNQAAVNEVEDTQKEKLDAVVTPESGEVEVYVDEQEKNDYNG